MLNAPTIAQPNSSAVPELGHLKAAAERISTVNYNLAMFFARFFGPTPEDANKSDDSVACYRNDLTAVFEQITQLEELVNRLQNIG